MVHNVSLILYTSSSIFMNSCKYSSYFMNGSQCFIDIYTYSSIFINHCKYSSYFFNGSQCFINIYTYSSISIIFHQSFLNIHNIYSFTNPPLNPSLSLFSIHTYHFSYSPIISFLNHPFSFILNQQLFS